MSVIRTIASDLSFEDSVLIRCVLRAAREAGLSLKLVVEAAGFTNGIVSRWLNHGGTPLRASAVAVLMETMNAAAEKQIFPLLVAHLGTQLAGKKIDAVLLIREARDESGDAWHAVHGNEQSELLAAIVWRLSKTTAPAEPNSAPGSKRARTRTVM